MRALLWTDQNYQNAIHQIVMMNAIEDEIFWSKKYIFKNGILKYLAYFNQNNTLFIEKSAVFLVFKKRINK